MFFFFPPKHTEDGISQLVHSWLEHENSFSQQNMITNDTSLLSREALASFFTLFH